MDLLQIATIIKNRLDKHNLEELRAICRVLGVSDEGTKVEVIQRLLRVDSYPDLST